MKKLFALLLLTSSLSTYAFSLEHIRSYVEADANVCGDENTIAEFEMKDLDLVFKSEMNWNRDVLFTIFKAFDKHIGFSDGIEKNYYVVTDQYEDAVTEISRALGAVSNFDKNMLDSCHSVSILKKMGMRISKRTKMPKVINPETIANHLSIGIRNGKNSLWATDKFHVVANLETKKLYIYFIW